MEVKEAKEYIGFIFIEEQTGIHIGVVPDLNFTSSYGENFLSCKDSLQEACDLYTEDIELPEVSDLEPLLEIPEIPQKHIIVYIKAHL